MKILSGEDYDKLPIYSGDDLGANYTKEKTTFKLWAPTADDVKVCLYEDGLRGETFCKQSCTLDEFGVWSTEINRDLLGIYFTYEVSFGEEVNIVVDPYAKAVGANGQRAMVIDLSLTDIEGWKEDKPVLLEAQTDAIIYEIHVRDMSISEDSGIINKGKFIGLVEENTKYNEVSTGLQHLKELGITHVHLLPSFDYFTVDETKLCEPQFNWGYDPLNYNVPEGSYSTNPFDGEVRIKEFKQMVKGFHDNGIGVIMDVVYNHTGLTEESWFHKIVPGYYHRQFEDGTFSDGSGCDNETASERAMVRKYIVDSVLYWAKEYHIDGFRFDLMAVHDIETMNLIREELDKIDKRIIMYGEGWNGGPSALNESKAAFKKNGPLLNSRIALFSDDLRDGIKGDVFVKEDGGFVNGGKDTEESIKFGVVASVNHPQVDYEKVNYSEAPWANEPTQTVSYVSAHDNLTLWDKLCATCPDEVEETLIKMDKLSNGIVLTCQGISFIHAGEEFLRTKCGVENSFKSPDHINKLSWSRKAKYLDVFNYYKGLISLRKAHPAFRMTTTNDINSNLKFLEVEEDNLVAFYIGNNANGDIWSDIVVIYNANKKAKEVELPLSDWDVVVDEATAGTEVLRTISGSRVQVAGISLMVLKK